MLRKKSKFDAFPNDLRDFPSFLSDEQDNRALLVDNPDGTISDDVDNLIAYARNPDPRNRGGFTFQEGRPPYKGKTLKVWNGDGSR